MKEGKYAKALAKIQVGAIFHAQEIRRIFLTYIYRALYGYPGAHPGWSLTWRPETNRNMCNGDVLLKGEFIS